MFFYLINFIFMIRSDHKEREHKKVFKGDYTMEKKTTIIDNMQAVKEFLIVKGASQNLVDFMSARIELQEKKRASKSTELTETQKENLILKDKVYAFVQENPKSTAKAIASHFGISSQKLTPIMSKLLVDGSVVFETVKKVKYFSTVE